MIGIYKIENKENGKVYIGKSKDIIHRWSEHEKALAKHEHHSLKLQADYDLYGGIEVFDFDVVELCDVSSLKERRDFYIKQYDAIANGYNSNEQNQNPERNEIVFTNSSYKELISRIGNSCLMTYFYMRFNADDSNTIILNQTQLAGEVGVSVLTVSKHIRTLMDTSVIRNIGKSGLYNKYEILI